MLTCCSYRTYAASTRLGLRYAPLALTVSLRWRSGGTLEAPRKRSHEVGLRYCGCGTCCATPVFVTWLSAALVVLPITVLPDELSGRVVSEQALEEPL